MRVITMLAGIALATTTLTPAAAEDSIVDGKPCNALCRQWMGLPAVPATPVLEASRELPVEPPLQRARAKIDSPILPQPAAPAIKATPAYRHVARVEDVSIDNPSSVSATEVPSFAPSKSETSVLTSEAHDASTPIVGNPRWKQYADTVFRFQGSLFAADYQKAHPTPPSTSAGLRVTR